MWAKGTQIRDPNEHNHRLLDFLHLFRGQAMALPETRCVHLRPVYIIGRPSPDQDHLILLLLERSQLVSDVHHFHPDDCVRADNNLRMAA